MKASNHQIKLSSIYDLIVNGSKYNINCRTFCGLLAPELTKNGFSKKKKNYWNIELKNDLSECKLSESMHYATLDQNKNILQPEPEEDTYQQIPPSVNDPPIKVLPKIDEMIHQPKKRYFCKFFFTYLNSFVTRNPWR